MQGLLNAARACPLQAACPRPAARLAVGGQAASRRRRTLAHSGGLSEPSLDELEQALSAAVAGEDYAEAARLRDALSSARGDATLEVEQANARFYAAFERAEMGEMGRAWGEGAHVRCSHPGASCIVGREDVLASWDMVFRSGARLRIRCEEVDVFVRDNVALLTCTEVVDAPSANGRLACTNVFERQNGVWKIIHHHVSAAV